MRLGSFLLLALFALTFGPAGTTAQDFKLEPGFTLLFNGKDLTGWKTRAVKTKDVTKQAESLDGKTEAYGNRFKVVDGTLVIDGSIKGDKYIHSAKEFSGDTHIKLEFKAGDGCNNDFLYRGVKFDITPKGVKNYKQGQWQLLEVVTTGDSIEWKSDGELQRKDKAKTEKSDFVIRAEFGSIAYRNIRIKSGK